MTHEPARRRRAPPSLPAYHCSPSRRRLDWEALLPLVAQSSTRALRHAGVPNRRKAVVVCAPLRVTGDPDRFSVSGTASIGVTASFGGGNSAGAAGRCDPNTLHDLVKVILSHPRFDIVLTDPIFGWRLSGGRYVGSPDGPSGLRARVHGTHQAQPPSTWARVPTFWSLISGPTR